MTEQTLSCTDFQLNQVAHAGKMWLTASASFPSPYGSICVHGYIPETELTTTGRWPKLSQAEQASLIQRIQQDSLGTLTDVHQDACLLVRNFLNVCAMEDLAPNIDELKKVWAGGQADLDQFEIDLASAISSARALVRASKMAGQVAQSVRLAEYPATFDAGSRTRRLIAVLGPTNSGKTYDAFKRLASVDSGVYLGPLRLLALEAFTRLNTEFGVTTSLVTGEEKRIVADSKVIASTIEMLDTKTAVDVAVIDEIQMLSDPDRGWAWTQAVVGANASEVWVLGALSAEPAIRALAQRLKLPLEVHYKERKNPLELGAPLAPSAKASLRSAEAGDAFIVFSRRDALNLRDDLLAKGRTVACIYGALSPEVRESEALRFSCGEAEILVATDAIGLGLNLPIRRIVFTSVTKYDGVARGELSVPLLQQIAGRAGRYGLDESAGRVSGVTPAEHSVVARLMACKQEPLPARGFQIAASGEYLQTMTMMTGETKLEALLTNFKLHADRGDGFFLPFVPDEQVKRAAVLDEIRGMSLTDKHIFSMAPMAMQCGAIDRAWRDWVTAVSKGREVRVDFLSAMPQLADLAEAEDSVRLLSAYRWFAHRLPDVFVDIERADAVMPGWTAAVDAHLKSKYSQGEGGGRNGEPSWYWATR